MIKRFCDRCNEEIEDKDSLEFLDVSGVKNDSKVELRMDLCSECRSALIRFLGYKMEGFERLPSELNDTHAVSERRPTESEVFRNAFEKGYIIGRHGRTEEDKW